MDMCGTNSEKSPFCDFCQTALCQRNLKAPHASRGFTSRIPSVGAANLSSWLSSRNLRRKDANSEIFNFWVLVSISHCTLVHQQKKNLLCLTGTCKAFVRKFSVRLHKPCQGLTVDLQPTYLMTYLSYRKV